VGAFGRGKAILLGEHGVVYGRPALAAGLAIGVTARARPAAASRLRVPAWGVEVGPDDEEPLARGFAALLEAEGAPPLEVELDVGLPAGAGLGCSAALGVALVRAIDEVLGREAPDAAVAERSMVWERVFHGNPSGVDAAVSAAGGVLLFERGRPPEPVAPREPLTLVIGDGGERASTRTMVEQVARMHRADPEKLEGVFDGMAALVRNGRLALEAGDLHALGQLINLNHALLSGLLLSTERLEEMCGAARAAGAHGAKLTGAGGGGCAIALVDPPRAEEVRAAVAAHAERAFVAEAGA